MIQLFKPKYEVEEVLNALRPVLESGWTGAGPICQKFEEEWNQFIGSKHSHFVNSATAALHIALRIQNLPKGSPVLTTPLTFVSTNSVILYESLHPVFVDINENDLSMDTTDFLEKKNASKAKAGIWVHYAGNASEFFEFTMESLKATDPEFQMTEDCAHAAGSFYSTGARVGSREDTIACFSYQAVKNLPTMDSGMISVNSPELLARVKRLAWMGIDKDTFARTNSSQKEVYKWKYDVPELGWKYNGNDIAATIARVQLKYLDRDNAFRKQIFQWYQRNFDNTPVTLVHQCIDSSHHLVVIRVKNRDEVIQALKDNGVAPGVHYLPNYEFPLFREYYTPGSCPVAEKVSKEIISLPNHLHLTKSDVDKISEIVINVGRL